MQNEDGITCLMFPNKNEMGRSGCPLFVLPLDVSRSLASA